VPGSIFAFSAHPANNGEPVWLGNDGNNDVSSATGFPVVYYSAEPVAVHLSNLNELWFDAEADGDKICWELVR
jgi:hypothetical protein